MNPVTTFEEGCASRSVDPTKLPGVAELPERFRQSVIDHYKLMVLTEAVNEGKKPNWKNGNKEKWFSWWRVLTGNKNRGSGLGLSLLAVDYFCTYTSVGSRLSSVSEDAARHLATTFPDIYEGALLEP